MSPVYGAGLSLWRPTIAFAISSGLLSSAAKFLFSRAWFRLVADSSSGSSALVKKLSSGMT